MKVDEWTSNDGHTLGGGEFPPCAGLTSNALPEAQSTVFAESSQTGVSTRNALIGTGDGSTSRPTNTRSVRNPKNVPHWYALRVTYGREKKVYDYLVSKNVEAYYPTITTIKLVNGKRRTIEESRLPNIFFARGTEDEIKSFVYDNVNLPHLRFIIAISTKVHESPDAHLLFPTIKLKILKSSAHPKQRTSSSYLLM